MLSENEVATTPDEMVSESRPLVGTADESGSEEPMSMNESEDQSPHDDAQCDLDDEAVNQIKVKASMLSTSEGPLSGGDIDVKRAQMEIQAMAEAAGLEVAASQEAPALTTRGHPEDDYRQKHAHEVTGAIDAGPISWELNNDGDEIDDLEMWTTVHPSSRNRVNLDFELRGQIRGFDFRAGGINTLAPKQTEGLAAALLDAAVQAREEARDPFRDWLNEEWREEQCEWLLDDYDVERDDSGCTRITVSNAVAAIVFDESEEDVIEINTDPLNDRSLNDATHIVLNRAQARKLRGLLDEALTAGQVERARYDDEGLNDDD